MSSNVLFGTTWEGGTNGVGTVFSVQTDRSGLTVLHTFSALPEDGIFGDNSDGAMPEATLLLASNRLYGTASGGGSSGFGTVFRLNLDGTGFTNLHSFTDGAASPRAGLLLISNYLYGTTFSGGMGYGSVFRLTTDGLLFTNLHSFTAQTNDALGPAGGLDVSGDTLFGTTSGGGMLQGGVIFALTTGGTGYTNLFNFQPVGGQSLSSTNTTGGAPNSTLLLVGDQLYGTTTLGGTNGNGVVFAVSTNGTSFTNLHTFTATTNSTNSDGISPICALLLLSNQLYGTTTYAGPYGDGTLYALNLDGSGFTNLYSFPPIFTAGFVDVGAAGPENALIYSGGTLYGTSTLGGEAVGNVYSLALASAPAPVPLAFAIGAGSLVLTWPDAAFSLQATPSLALSFTNVAGATSPFTNSFVGGQQFFRLVAN